jgi:hypothetical protein
MTWDASIVGNSGGAFCRAGEGGRNNRSAASQLRRDRCATARGGDARGGAGTSSRRDFPRRRVPGLGGVPGMQKLADATLESRVVTIAGRYQQERGYARFRRARRATSTAQVSPAVLPRVVDALMRGEAAISRSVTMAIVEVARSRVGIRPVRIALTQRERDALDLMAAGASTQQISSELAVRSRRCRATPPFSASSASAHEPRRSEEPTSSARHHRQSAAN